MRPEEIISDEIEKHVDVSGRRITEHIIEELEEYGYRLVHSGSDTTHWEGCWENHHACAIALIKATH